MEREYRVSRQELLSKGFEEKYDDKLKIPGSVFMDDDYIFFTDVLYYAFQKQAYNEMYLMF